VDVRPPDRPTPAERAAAVIEVLLCSGFATQIPLLVTFRSLGFSIEDARRHLLPLPVFIFSLADTALLLALVVLFLAAHRERPLDVLIGRRPIGRELRAGIWLVPVALVIGVGVLLLVQLAAPGLHTVARNPLEDLLATRRDALLFAVLVVVAGGLREEVQRAFLVHRFDTSLGGGPAGIVVSSIAFGLGHLAQGADAVIVTGLLGALWGTVYFRRGSAIAPFVSHSGFDLLQILRYVVTGAG
jgi:membrane protease YdiL (CAAX protease family)